MLERKIEERTTNLSNHNHLLTEIPPRCISQEPCIDKKEFSKQIDKEYTSTGAHGFLRLTGLFSDHVNKKLNLDSDYYHSMNMLSQKRTIINKLAKTVHRENSIDLRNQSHHKSIDVDPNFTMDKADLKTTDNTSSSSDRYKSMLMYKRCSKLEDWKDFQTKKSINKFDVVRPSLVSTLPVLKFHKPKIFKARRSPQGRRSN